MTDHRAQTDRIKEKLERARKSDPELREFGVAEHRYLIGPPAHRRGSTEFENAFEVTLPDCYRAFLTLVGNGSPVADHGLVSPEGIYPLTEKEIATYERNHGVSVGPAVRAYLARYGTGSPSTTDAPPARDVDSFRSVRARHTETSSTSVRQADARASATLRPRRAHGAGHPEGRPQVQEPYFYRAANFLDWYEGWLDEILPDEST